MVEIIREKSRAIHGAFCDITQELSDGSLRKISMYGNKVVTTKIMQKDGSYILLNENNVKFQELTSEGYLRKYDPVTEKLKEESSPQGVITRFYDNGNIKSVRDDKNDIYTSYYENKKLARHQEKDYLISWDINGSIIYEFKNGKLNINSDLFSFYRLGVKSQNNDRHWEEKVTLNPKKKRCCVWAATCVRMPSQPMAT